MSELLAFVLGAGVALAAQALGHLLTVRRERRTDFARALDRVVSAYAEGERALDDLTDAIDRGLNDLASMFSFARMPHVMDALAQAERVRVEMRAALFSIRVRLHDRDSSLFRALDGAFSEWELGFLKCKVMVREDDNWPDSLMEGRGHASTFRGEFYDVALERAADVLGRLRA